MFYILVDAVSCERGRKKVGGVGKSVARFALPKLGKSGFPLSLSQSQIYII
jgi:hypothetical protein